MRMKCGRKYDAVHTWILGFHMFCCETEMWTGRIPFRELKFFNVINGGDGLRNLHFSIVLGTRPLNGIVWLKSITTSTAKNDTKSIITANTAKNGTRLLLGGKTHSGHYCTVVHVMPFPRNSTKIVLLFYTFSMTSHMFAIIFAISKPKQPLKSVCLVIYIFVLLLPIQTES